MNKEQLLQSTLIKQQFEIDMYKSLLKFMKNDLEEKIHKDMIDLNTFDFKNKHAIGFIKGSIRANNNMLDTLKQIEKGE